MATIAYRAGLAASSRSAGIGDRNWIVPASVLVLCQYVAALLLDRATGFGGNPPIATYTTLAFVLSVAGGVAVLLAKLWRFWREDEPHPIARLRHDTDPIAIACYFIGFQLVALQIGALTWLKQMLPWVIPYWADPALASFDRLILGTDAWRLVPDMLMPALDRLYVTWFPIKTAILISILCLAPSKTKAQAMLAYFVILGLMGVTGQYLLSSGGPVFYDRIVGGGEFADLSARIGSHGPVVSRVSQFLWDAYVGHTDRIANGISAMPSIHVATTAWVALVVSAYTPKLKWAGWGYWLVIFVGSVALGWHYVSDSVVGTAGAIACWMAAGKLVEASALGRTGRKAWRWPARAVGQ